MVVPMVSSIEVPPFIIQYPKTHLTKSSTSVCFFILLILLNGARSRQVFNNVWTPSCSLIHSMLNFNIPSIIINTLLYNTVYTLYNNNSTINTILYIPSLIINTLLYHTVYTLYNNSSTINTILYVHVRL